VSKSGFLPRILGFLLLLAGFAYVNQQRRIIVISAQRLQLV
jgi:hypothetical protein